MMFRPPLQSRSKPGRAFLRDPTDSGNARVQVAEVRLGGAEWWRLWAGWFSWLS